MERLTGRACVGLVVALLGIRSLSSPLAMVLRTAIDSPESLELVLIVPVFTAVFQIATGCLFAFRVRTAGWLVLAAYLASAVGFVVVALDAEDTALGAISLAVGALGTPAMIAGLLAYGRPDGASPRQELGALLVVLSISLLASISLRMFEIVHEVTARETLDLGTMSTILWMASYVAVAAVQLRAGLQLRRGEPTAVRAVAVYAIVAVSMEVVWLMVGIGMAMFENDYDGRFRMVLISVRIINALTTIAYASFIWWFAHRHPAPPTTHTPTSPAWHALVFVPFVLVRPLMLVVDDRGLLTKTETALISVGLVAMAIATTVAVGAALRERIAAVPLAVVASALGVVTTIYIAVVTELSRGPKPMTAGVFVGMVVATAVIASIQRGVTQQVPRAIVRR